MRFVKTPDIQNIVSEHSSDSPRTKYKSLIEIVVQSKEKIHE